MFVGKMGLVSFEIRIGFGGYGEKKRDFCEWWRGRCERCTYLPRYVQTGLRTRCTVCRPDELGSSRVINLFPGIADGFTVNLFLFLCLCLFPYTTRPSFPRALYVETGNLYHVLRPSER